MSSTKGKTLYFNNKSMDYVTFGKGKKPLVIIPGLGDGLASVKGMAQMLALAYRGLATALMMNGWLRMLFIKTMAFARLA